MEIVRKIDEIGTPAWVGLMVLSFVLFWPIGLALLAFLIWSRRMGCCGNGARWHDRMHRSMRGHRAGRHHGRRPYTSGNAAFDEYREETLRRLEEEQQEFRSFLERLRHARDKAEFDQFMAEQKRPRDDAAGDDGA